ncbi:MAG: hypothetical protein IOC39_16985 [Burkholderia sp.]|jgi:hypothetical protein|uniref:hypothetical protein n=1 Tax=Burkholderia TaxID=32008 RepID=UPI00158E2178|nr:MULTISPECIES: hypothetical protein [Burkholderia]MBY8606296.1 hypothetical protein [Burkholderia arboris]MCA3783298.1 hypothetical protein [Burkholderia sp.]MCA3787792.1 hypothetical protein [Burkholderia sp.]MCA3796206.1 hypothetical protein [Burkholderia sp.]MCA3801619.1 hypothetical protein [Burkholderia sp.]
MSISRAERASVAPLPSQSTADQPDARRQPGFSSRPAVTGKLADLKPRTAPETEQHARKPQVRESEPAALERYSESQMQLAQYQSKLSLTQAEAEAIKAGSAGILKATETR